MYKEGYGFYEISEDVYLAGLEECNKHHHGRVL